MVIDNSFIVCIVCLIYGTIKIKYRIETKKNHGIVGSVIKNIGSYYGKQNLGLIS